MQDRSLRPLLPSLVAALLAPLILRLAALAASGAPPALGDARGLFVDLGAGLCFGALLAAAGRGTRVAAVVLAALWTVGHYGNYELVVTLGALASLGDAAFLLDPTFVSGSALALSRPVLFAGLLLATLALAGWRAGAVAARPVVATLAAGLALLGATALWPWSGALATWRQTDFMVHGLNELRGPAGGAGTPFADPAVAMLDLLPTLRADLSGEPLLQELPPARNVLLVVLESVSGGYLPSLAADQGQTSVLSMPGLDAFARENLRYPVFVSHQRKTNRGLYALLCGELPSLRSGLPKMSAAAVRPWRVCLPQLLADAGFASVYLQAAPLAFMLKDQFMPRAGFQRVHGHESFQGGYASTAWGVDDRAFFERAGELVLELDAAERPWFLTLLNVGTHHPFVVPDDYRPQLVPAVARSMAYLDEAFSAFVERLEGAGILEDTLLVVTSDESFGAPGFGVDPVTKVLSQNQGLLIVRLPSRRGLVVREPFGQQDLALSLLDHLGLADRGRHLFGRSVFRHYDAGRHLFFANGNLRSAGAIDPEGRVLLCLHDFASCQRFAVPDGRIFGREREALPWDPARDGLVARMAERSAPWLPEGEREIALLAEPALRLSGRDPLVVHGGQYVDLEPGEWLEVDYDVSVRGEEDVFFVHVFAGHGNERLLRRDVLVPGGSRLVLRYTFAPADAQVGLQSKTTVRLPGGGVARLEHHVARMAVRSEGTPPAPGVVVERAEIKSGE